MKVIREKSILEKIDVEIDDKSKPPIIRIDLDESEFYHFLLSICEGVISTSFEGQLNRLKMGLEHHVTDSSIRSKVPVRGRIKYLGSYVVYRGVSVQCCYDEE